MLRDRKIIFLSSLGRVQEDLRVQLGFEVLEYEVCLEATVATTSKRHKFYQK